MFYTEIEKQTEPRSTFFQYLQVFENFSAQLQS